MSTNEVRRGNPVLNFIVALVSALAFAIVLMIWDFGVIPGNSTVILKEGEQVKFTLSCTRVSNWTVLVEDINSESSAVLEASIPTYSNQTVSSKVTLAEKEWLLLENCVGREERAALVYDVDPEQKVLVLKVNAFGLSSPVSLGSDAKTESKLVTLANYIQLQLESFQQGTVQERSLLVVGAFWLLMAYTFPFLYGIGVWRKTDVRFQRALQSEKLEQYHREDEFWSAYFMHAVVIVVTMSVFAVVGITFVSTLEQWLAYFGWFKYGESLEYFFFVLMYAIQAAFSYTLAFWMTSQIESANSKFRQNVREWREAF